MCRNIKPLFNFDPPATNGEIHDAALQYVRKLTGFHKPSTVNSAAFEQAITEISKTTEKLFTALQTNANPKNREKEARKRRAKSLKRFSKTTVNI